MVWSLDLPPWAEIYTFDMWKQYKVLLKQIKKKQLNNKNPHNKFQSLLLFKQQYFTLFCGMVFIQLY